MNYRYNHRRGVVLLVVLGMLAFLGVLVVTYVVFTGRSRQSAFAVANSEFRKPMHREVVNDAMMKLLRGTSDVNDPFYGEDLLSDLYGRTGGIPRLNGRAHHFISALRPALLVDSDGTTPRRERGVLSLGDGFVKVPYEIPLDTTDPLISPYPDPLNPPGPINLPKGSVSETVLEGSDLGFDDYFAGMVMTFDEGPLKDQSFRILRSTGHRSGSDGEDAHAMKYSIFIELDPNMTVVLDDQSEVKIGELSAAGSSAIASLFYSRGLNAVWGDPPSAGIVEAGEHGSDDIPYRIRLTPRPLNGTGIGFDGENLTQTTSIGTLPLPKAFLPVGNTDKLANYAIYGDFDEPYDAPDFQNMFLAHRYTDAAGNVQIIPSFHRPALINYLANEEDLSSITPAKLRQLILAIQRATFRPIPWAELAPAPPLITTVTPPSNPRFTGGNTSFALRSPNKIDDPTNKAHIARLDQLLRALVQGPWDVDNDGDGINDSVWVDLSLPLITSPEGKLLRPMVAALIEDTGGRLHLNAHGSLAQLGTSYQGSITAPWGGTADSTINQTLMPFRGLGYGPAEIFMPMAGEVHSDADLFSSTSDRLAFLQERYREANSPLPGIPVPGERGNDVLDRILTGTRPGVQTWASGYGFTQDPWGRGGIGVSRSGRLYAGGTGSGLVAEDLGAMPPQPLINENTNDPYEVNPRGEFGGDSPITFAEFDAVMRNIDWDRDTLPDRLRDLLADSLNSDPQLHRLLTTRSVSLDVPPAIRPEGNRSTGPGANLPTSLTRVLRERMDLPFGTAAERAAAWNNFRVLVGPELRLGHKLDVNRPFGNGADDDSDGVIDEPGEVVINGLDDNGNGSVDEPGEVEARAFPSVSSTSDPTIPTATRTSFGSAAPNYSFGNSVGGRQLLARNLYVLMMAFSGNGYDFPMNDVAAIDPSTVYDFKARKLAQWAVNVVDYRDPDAIMTPFHYDPKPFDVAGWNPPAIVPGEVPRYVLWGVESPELLFQESLALHDVRVKDTTLENANAGTLKDDDLTDAETNTDSIRIPQGSLFLELYNPRARIDTGSSTDARTQTSPVEAPPQELYTFSTALNQYVLDLSKTAPVGAGGTAMPVWRIAITKPHYPEAPDHPARGTEPLNDAPEESDPEILRAALKDTASFELERLVELDSTSAPGRLAIDRVVFFTPALNSTAVATALTDVDTPEQVFFNYLGAAGSSVGLLPEQYLVLAPRTTTHLGSQTYPASGPPLGPSPQNFTISPDADHVGLVHTNLADKFTTLNTTTLTHQALPLVIAADPSQLETAQGGTWSTAAAIAAKLPEGVGLNVSEPLPGANYYPEPNFQLDSTKDVEFPLEDAYVDYTTPATSQVKDIPVDLDNDRPIVEWTRARTGSDDPDEPFLGFQERFCTAFLQRLADPTLPYQNNPALPNYNPYRSVDWISIDLTVFSGEENESKFGQPDPADYANGSRQRDGQDANGTGTGILYSNHTVPPATEQLTPSTNYFPIELSGAADPSTGAYIATPPRQTLSHLNAGFGQPIGGPNRGQPVTPFALHEWLNRPFATPYELLMVPATSQGRLFEEFTIAATVNPYALGTVAEFKAPFGHLLNFFQAEQDEADAAQFYRIFDYIDTRPPFRGELQAINPNRLTTSSSGNAYLDRARNQFVNLFQAPFNFFSDNRREGEINLNTVADYPVWMGLMYGHLTSSERGASASTGTFAAFRNNRRGYVLPSTGGVERPVIVGTNVQAPPYNYAPQSLDPEFPTEFAGAYRPNAAAGLAPVVKAGDDHLRRIDTSGFSPADAGLLRRDEPTKDAMFVRDTPVEPWRNRDRNAFFRYQTLMRMPNLVTEQSHVYLVRLTVGYFEVDRATLNTGSEYKADLGQQQRYHATFMIDRSVPVAYEPGVDRNVSNTILYQRIAE